MFKKSYKISERLLSLKIIDSVRSYVLFIHSNSNSDHKSFVMLLKKHVGFFTSLFLKSFFLHGYYLFSAALDFICILLCFLQQKCTAICYQNDESWGTGFNVRNGLEMFLFFLCFFSLFLEDEDFL